ncbi:MAG TPA: protein translocase subunit SecF [Pyrinomonadaceae bacterium]|jgi:preprotein translocase subunit SecF|nr:protein translocase subunit SecF [Pyrinomonadaceae bacterium]
MVRLFHNINFDWLANRRAFIAVSILLMLAGMGSAIFRYSRGQAPFNLGVDFKGGTLITAKFKQRPSAEDIRASFQRAQLHDAIIQPVGDKPDEVLIKLPRLGSEENAQDEAQVDVGRTKVAEALKSFGAQVPADQNFAPEGNSFKIVGTDAVGAVAGAALRNQAVAVTLLALVGILVFISLRFEWTYGAAAVIAVFHDVLVTLGMFSVFYWEINLTVIAALLTLVGFSVNDTIVTFDRVRENLRLHRRDSLYKITNDSINQTLSRTIITSGLVFLSVVAMVLFGGEVLRPFSLALVIGIVFGTYSSIAIASPIMVWWQQRLERQTPRAAPVKEARAAAAGGPGGARAPRARTAASGRSQRAAR